MTAMRWWYRTPPRCLAEAVDEWRFIIGWMEERGDTVHVDWPRSILQHLETQQTGD
ncbi:MAG: hypothetical protein JO345_26345 [Streptosporangiaceae bacterium]|nr:hypothetical protein [Streptosporangiaceae bacterium]